MIENPPTITENWARRERRPKPLGCSLASVVNRRENAPRGAGDEAPFYSGLVLKFVSRAPCFCSRAPRAVVSLRHQREGRRRRRTSEGGFPLGCLRLFWSRRDAADGGTPSAGIPRIATLVLNGALTRACIPSEFQKGFAS